MKRIIVLLAFVFLATVVSVDAMNVRSPKGKPHNGWHRGRKSVAAPLDGGLLTVLGAAGIAYYASRKKKNGLDV